MIIKVYIFWAVDDRNTRKDSELDFNGTTTLIPAVWFAHTFIPAWIPVIQLALWKNDVTDVLVPALPKQKRRWTTLEKQNMCFVDNIKRRGSLYLYVHDLVSYSNKQATEINIFLGSFPF